MWRNIPVAKVSIRRSKAKRLVTHKLQIGDFGMAFCLDGTDYRNPEDLAGSGTMNMMAPVCSDSEAQGF